MMTVYFFSRHNISPLMVQHLNEKLQTEIIAEQFKGTVSGIKKTDGQIHFIESLEVEVEGKKEVQKFERTIPVDSTVIAVCPVTMQIDWLNAGANLLIPQVTKVPVGETGAEFVYTGLLHVEKIQIVSSQWAGQPKSLEEVMEGRKLTVAVE